MGEADLIREDVVEAVAAVEAEVDVKWIYAVSKLDVKLIFLQIPTVDLNISRQTENLKLHQKYKASPGHTNLKNTVLLFPAPLQTHFDCLFFFSKRKSTLVQL